MFPASGTFMLQDNTLIGRTEKRLPIIVVVSLAKLGRTTDGAEWTYTVGIRVEVTQSEHERLGIEKDCGRGATQQSQQSAETGY
jgi:hypothetical protein